MPDFNDFFWRSFLFNLYDDTNQDREDNNIRTGDVCHFCGSRGVASHLFLWKERGIFVCWNCKDKNKVPCPHCGRTERTWNCEICG